jgi:hypothetical protein
MLAIARSDDGEPAKAGWLNIGLNRYQTLGKTRSAKAMFNNQFPIANDQWNLAIGHW